MISIVAKGAASEYLVRLLLVGGIKDKALEVQQIWLFLRHAKFLSA